MKKHTGKLRGSIVDDLLINRVKETLPPPNNEERRGVHERRELQPGEERVWRSFAPEPPYASVTLPVPLLGRTIFYAVIPNNADPTIEKEHLPKVFRRGEVKIHLKNSRRKRRIFDD